MARRDEILEKVVPIELHYILYAVHYFSSLFLSCHSIKCFSLLFGYHSFFWPFFYSLGFQAAFILFSLRRFNLFLKTSALILSILKFFDLVKSSIFEVLRDGLNAVDNASEFVGNKICDFLDEAI